MGELGNPTNPTPGPGDAEAAGTRIRSRRRTRITRSLPGLLLSSLGRSVARALGRGCRASLRAFPSTCFPTPEGRPRPRRAEPTPASNPLQAAAPARGCRRPSSGLSLSSLSGFYRQLLVGDINCPDEFIDNFDVTEHRRNYPPAQNVKSEKKQVLRRDPTAQTLRWVKDHGTNNAGLILFVFLGGRLVMEAVVRGDGA